VLLFALFASVGFVLVLGPFLAPYVEYYTRSIAVLSGAIIRMAGGHVRVTDFTLTAPASGLSVAVVNGCNGINVVVLLWSAQLAWPAIGWIDKLKGMVLGALVIQLANTLRVISLFYLNQWNQAWFEWMHLYVWEILIMILGLAVFALSIRRTPANAVSGEAK
jgi:exosortase H (IPTLxxWG-CTERM-specific)